MREIKINKLTVNTGSMFSGKSRELQRQGERHTIAGHSVVFITPSMDNRYGEGVVSTHVGSKVKAIPVDVSVSILGSIPQGTQVVCVDEVQFFGREIISDIEILLTEGVSVYVSGLDMDYRGIPFNTTMELMARADVVNKYHAVCEGCGEDAIFSARTSDSTNIVELGEKDIYKPLCRKCWDEVCQNH